MSTLFYTYIILALRVDYFTLGLTLSSHSGRIISHLDLHYPPTRSDYFTLGLTLSSHLGWIISHLDLHYPPTQSGLIHTWIDIILPLGADYFTLGLTLSSHLGGIISHLNWHSGQIISHLDLHYHATQSGLFHTWTYIILPLGAGVYWNGLPGNILVPHLGSTRRVQTGQVAVGWHQAPIHVWGLHNNLLGKSLKCLLSVHTVYNLSLIHISEPTRPP